MPAVYDTIIVGAGIAGATLAYTLKEKQEKILVLERKGIAAGGSGAAGAFVSPKIGKGSPLQQLTNEAFAYAKDFYLSNCPMLFHQTGVIRIPKDPTDAAKFPAYTSFHHQPYENYSTSKLQSLGINTPYDALYFPEAGDCDAVAVCQYLLQGIEVVKYHVSEMTQKNGVWYVGDYCAKRVVLATGYESHLIDLRYMGIRGTWGTRGDYFSQLPLSVSMHQAMSVGANHEGVIKLGATHEKGVVIPEPCKKEQAHRLRRKASDLIDTSDLKLSQSYCGMRAGSKDYFPLVGKVIDAEWMLSEYPALRRGAKPLLRHIEGLYVLNGLGGRGFVFAPLMAKLLAEHLVDGTILDARINPDRLFYKWARKEA